MTEQSLLELAIEIALQAHGGKVDKGGEPYILHPLRLLNKMDTIDERIVALLHDVIEDSDITIQYLRKNGFSKKILTAVKVLTKKENQPYQQYILAIKKDSLANKIKQADLKDNMDTSRLKTLTEADNLRIKKYKDAYNTLTDK